MHEKAPLACFFPSSGCFLCLRILFLQSEFRLRRPAYSAGPKQVTDLHRACGSYFMALRADFGASRLYGPPGGFWRFAALRLCGEFWRFAALRLCGRIWISRLFQVFPEEFCSEIQFKFRISGQEFHPDIPVIFVVGNSLEESLIVDGSIL